MQRRECQRMGLEITSIIKYIYPTSHYAKPHAHPCYEIIVYLSGNGSTTIAGTKYKFSPHTVALIPPDTIHDELYSARGGELICIYFECAKLLHTYTAPLIYVADFTAIQQFANLLYQEIRTQPLYHNEKAPLLLQCLLLDLSRACNETHKEKNSMESVYHYICYNYANKLNYRLLAAESGFSYDYFRRVFRSIYGISPQKLQIQQRFLAAQKLLAGNEASITDIAISCGFADSSQFAHMYKKKYGISPSRHRKEMHPETPTQN